MVYTPAKVQQGIYDVWHGVTPPADGSGLVLVAGAPGTGTHLGLTQGNADFSRVLEKAEIEAEQILDTIGVYNIKGSLTLKFNWLELLNPTAMEQLLMESTAVVDDAVNSVKIIGMGGEFDPPSAKLQSWLFVQKQRTTSSLYWYMLLYEAFVNSDLAFSIGKSDTSQIPVELKAIADTSRSTTGMVGHIGFQYTP